MHAGIVDPTSSALQSCDSSLSRGTHRLCVESCAGPQLLPISLRSPRRHIRVSRAPSSHAPRSHVRPSPRQGTHEQALRVLRCLAALVASSSFFATFSVACPPPGLPILSKLVSSADEHDYVTSASSPLQLKRSRTPTRSPPHRPSPIPRVVFLQHACLRASTPIWHECEPCLRSEALAPTCVLVQIASEHAHSNCVLISQSRFKIDGVWHTWIDYDRFTELYARGEPFGALDYAKPTPTWAVYNVENEVRRNWIRHSCAYDSTRPCPSRCCDGARRLSSVTPHFDDLVDFAANARPSAYLLIVDESLALVPSLSCLRYSLPVHFSSCCFSIAPSLSH
eukprot:6177680-Pleurochrysis_carterae.AAC.1